MVAGQSFGVTEGIALMRVTGFYLREPRLMELYSNVQFLPVPYGRYNSLHRPDDYIHFYSDGHCYISDSFIMSYFSGETNEPSAGWRFSAYHFTLDLISPSVDLVSFTIVPLEVGQDEKVTSFMIDGESFEYSPCFQI